MSWQSSTRSDAAAAGQLTPDQSAGLGDAGTDGREEAFGGPGLEVVEPVERRDGERDYHARVLLRRLAGSAPTYIQGTTPCLLM